MIDVCNSKPANAYEEAYNKFYAAAEKGACGNFNQKKYPVNPVAYMKERNLGRIFRFILTHPDMDHMDGLETIFREFKPANFWDTNNIEDKDDFPEGGRFSERDWKFYRSLRDGNPQENPKRLMLFSGSCAQYYNRDERNEPGGDGLNILAPTVDLVAQANACEDYNDCSYVLLYRTTKHRVLFAGDSHDSTWEHILSRHEFDVKDVDVLIAPHHGRDSDRSYDFLDVVNPALTLFGNAPSEHLAYSAWSSRSLQIITNNQAGSILIDLDGDNAMVYVTCREFANRRSILPFQNPIYKGYYYWGTAQRRRAIGA
jgi:beta-lactamase superfamily II metal-dependent hydrolase